MPKQPSGNQVAGQTIGSVVGSGLGTAVGGPIGAPIGSLIGGATGSAIGSNTDTPGGAIGTAVGSTFGPFGALVGGEIGSGIFGGDSKAQKETGDRKALLDSYRKSGLLDSNYSLALPDGSSTSFMQGGSRPWANPSRKGGGPSRNLFNYETDYTNDLDYLSGMTGITLSRMLSGKTDKATDQLGNQLGNSFLGKLGYGNNLTHDNFTHVMNNARSVYASRGIKSKEDMLALVNKMYGDGRINEFDHNVGLQTANLVFDNDFGMAQQLMGGRDKGIAAAQMSPSNAGPYPQNKPGTIYSPIISPEEALLSVQPFFDYYHKHFPSPHGAAGMGALSSLATAAGAITALGGAYKGINKQTNGQLGDWVKGGLSSLAQSLGISSGPNTDVAPLPAASSVFDATAMDSSGLGSAVSDLVGSDSSGLADLVGSIL